MRRGRIIKKVGLTPLYLAHVLGICILCVLAVPMVFTQEIREQKPAQCKRTSKVRGNFKTLFAGPSGTSVRIYVRVDPKNQTDTNYVAISSELKAKYCKEREVYVAFFDTREHYELFNVPQPELKIAGTPRALYVLNRLTGREILEVYRIVDGTIETREIKPQ